MTAIAIARRFKNFAIYAILICSLSSSATSALSASTEPQVALRHADTSDCGVADPTGLILYITTPEDPTREPRKLVVAEPSGKIVRTINVRNPRWLAPANQPGKVFVYTFDADLYVIDALTGDAKWVFNEDGTSGVWPRWNDTRVTPNHDWQVIYGEGKHSEDRFVNLNTGEVQKLEDWITPARVDNNYEYSEFTPDGKHLVMYFNPGILMVGEAGKPNTLRTIALRAKYQWTYSVDGESMFYLSFGGNGSTSLTKIRFEQGEPETVATSYAAMDLYQVPDSNQVVVLNRISDGEARLETYDLGTGAKLASMTIDANVYSLFPGPNAQHIEVWGKDRDGGFIRFIDLDTGDQLPMDSLSSYFFADNWSNSRWILANAYQNQWPFTSQFPAYGLDLKTGALMTIPELKLPVSNYSTLQISDDGRYHILLVTLTTGRKGFVVLDLGGVKNLVLSTGDDYGAVFSTDDCWVAYSAHQEFDTHSNNNLYVVPTNGREGPTRIGEGMNPIWIMD